MSNTASLSLLQVFLQDATPGLSYLEVEIQPPSNPRSQVRNLFFTAYDSEGDDHQETDNPVIFRESAIYLPEGLRLWLPHYITFYVLDPGEYPPDEVINALKDTFKCLSSKLVLGQPRNRNEFQARLHQDSHQ
jgi:hypothetical protein